MKTKNGFGTVYDPSQDRGFSWPRRGTRRSRKIADPAAVGLAPYEFARLERIIKVALEKVINDLRLNRNAFTKQEIWKRNGMSKTTFYDLVKAGLGPKVFGKGRLRLISRDAERDWIKKLEEHAAEEDKAKS